MERFKAFWIELIVFGYLFANDFEAVIHASYNYIYKQYTLITFVSNYFQEKFLKTVFTGEFPCYELF